MVPVEEETFHFNMFLTILYSSVSFYLKCGTDEEQSGIS